MLEKCHLRALSLMESVQKLQHFFKHSELVRINRARMTGFKSVCMTRIKIILHYVALLCVAWNLSGTIHIHRQKPRTLNSYSRKHKPRREKHSHKRCFWDNCPGILLDGVSFLHSRDKQAITSVTNYPTFSNESPPQLSIPIGLD